MKRDMGHIQPIKFSDIDDFLNYLPERERNITLSLRNLILENLPNCKEKLSYNVPYYYLHSRVCFIWPASIPWGKIKEGVALGFCRGNMINDELGYLQMDNRKSVVTRRFKDVGEIDVDILKVYLEEAVEVDRLGR